MRGQLAGLAEPTKASSRQQHVCTLVGAVLRMVLLEMVEEVLCEKEN